MSTSEQILVQMDAQGRVVLPKALRAKAKQYYTCQKEKDGTVHLIPVVGVITTKQAYFWTKRWQAGERAADKALAEGRFTKVPPDKLRSFLKKI